MPVVVRVDRMAAVIRELEFLATHLVRVGVLTGPMEGAGSPGDAPHVVDEPLTGTALRDRNIETLARKFKRQDKAAKKRGKR